MARQTTPQSKNYKAKLRRQAAAQGLTLSTPDCQIAAAAIQHHYILLTTDKDFSNLAELVPLQLV